MSDETMPRNLPPEKFEQSDPEIAARPASPWSPAHPNFFLSVVPSGSTLYASTTQGLLWYDAEQEWWRAVLSSPGGAWMPNCIASGRAGSIPAVYAVCQHGFYVSYDGARSWTERSLPAGFKVARPALAASQYNEGRLYLFDYLWESKTRAGLALWTSGDGGQTWTGPLRITKRGLRGGFIHHPLLLAGADTVFMATWEGVFRWGWGDDFQEAEQGHPLVKVEQLTKSLELHAMAVSDSSSSDLIAIAGDFGTHDKHEYHLQISKNGGDTWSNKDPYPYRFRVDDLLCVEDLLFARVGRWDPAGGGKFAESILMTKNAGDTWIDVTTPQFAAVLAGDGGGGADMWPRVASRGEGLAFGAGRLFLPRLFPGLYSVELSALRALAPGK